MQQISKKNFAWKVAAIFIAAALLVGCGGGTTPTLEPTVDQKPTFDAIASQAAQTVVANLTLNAPTATLVPTETAAPAATETPLPTATTVVLPSSTPTIAAPTWTRVPATVVPTITNTPVTYSCTITEQGPATGDDIPVNAEFDGRWVIKNTSEKAWTAADTDITFVSGNKFGAGKEMYDLPADVAAGGSITFVIDMVAPNTAGRQNSSWAVRSGGQTVCMLYLSIDITD